MMVEQRKSERETDSETSQYGDSTNINLINLHVFREAISTTSN
jgi:hypothetical protein